MGWLLLIPIGILSVFLIWYHGDLNELSPASSLDNVRDLSDVMSRNLLSKITKDQTPKGLAQVVSKQPGGYFFGARFGIGREFLQELSAEDEGSTALVWKLAIELAKKLAILR